MSARLSLPAPECVGSRRAARRRGSMRVAGRTPPGVPQADVVLTADEPDEVRVAPRLKWIHSTAVGVGGVLVPGRVARYRGDQRARRAQEPSEHAIALVLATPGSMLRLSAGGRAVGQGTAGNRTPALTSSRMLVGPGAIGGRVRNWRRVDSKAAGCGAGSSCRHRRAWTSSWGPPICGGAARGGRGRWRRPTRETARSAPPSSPS
jgi:hypothetical protein